MANLRDEMRFANQYKGATFHLDDPVGLDEHNQVGGDAKTLPVGTHVRFVEARMDEEFLWYDFEIIDTGERFRVESEDGVMSMDTNPIWDGDRLPDGKARD